MTILYLIVYFLQIPWCNFIYLFIIILLFTVVIVLSQLSTTTTIALSKKFEGDKIWLNGRYFTLYLT